MMRINITHEGGGTRLELIGKLAGPWVSELEDVAGREPAPLRIETAQLQFIDQAGRYLLELLRARGAQVLLLALLCLAPLKAETLTLTLEDAVRLALKQNPQVQIANLNRAVAQEESVVARSALLPQARLELSDQVRRGSVEANVGFAIPGVPGHVGPFQVINVGPAFSMPIFDTTVLNRWKMAKQNRETVAAGELTIREQTVGLVVGQYLAAERQQASVEAARSRVELADALHRQAKNLQGAGVGTGLDTLRANQKLQVEKQSLIQQETALSTTLLGLVKLLNVPPGTTLALKPSTVPAEVDAGVAPDRPEIRSIDSRLAVARLEEKSARQERLPKVSFNGTWGQQGTMYNNLIPAYQIGGTVSIPLWTSGRIGAEIAKSEIEIKKLEREREDLRNQIAQDVETAREQLSAARREVDVANLGVELARQEVDQSRDRFQAGVANNIEVVTAQDSLARANESQIAARYRVNVARADLARALGRMESTYAR